MAAATVTGAAATATGAAVPPRRWAMRACTKARDVLPCMAWRAAAISRFVRNGGGAGHLKEPGVSGGDVSIVVGGGGDGGGGGGGAGEGGGADM